LRLALSARVTARRADAAQARTPVLSASPPMKPVRIIVFAKAPLPGRVKTRLAAALGSAGAALLARRLLARSLAAALAARVGAVELCAAPGVDDPAWSGIALPAGLKCTAQGGGDLGARMARAAKRAIAGGEAAILVGTDCAEMDATLLADAATLLADVDAVIHPTADGGYALLGLNRFDARVFTGIAWSTDTVAAATLERLRALGWSLRVGRTLHDIDEPGDLVRLERLGS
jgi:rSAM/selenodomain-associated transferase 1